MEEQNISPQPQPPEPIISPPRQKLSLATIIIVLFLLVVGVGAYYLGTKQATIDNNLVPTKIPTATIVRPTLIVSAIPTSDSEKTIYVKDEGWGPCPPEGICIQKTTLYSSGRLVFKGEKNGETFLSKDLINQIVTEIKKTGVMNKPCEASIVVDYGVDYKIYIDNQEKSIKYPGCFDELKEIEKLFL